MSEHRKALLKRLAMIHDRRQEIRRRQLARQQTNLAQAQRELAAQREREATASQRFADLVRRVHQRLRDGDLTAAEALQLRGYLDIQRTLVEAESIETQVAGGIVEVAQTEVEEARSALRQTRAATEKVGTMHDKLAQELQRQHQARAQIEADDVNMDAHARGRGRP